MDVKRTFVFSSDWHFLAEGIKIVQDQFLAKLRAKGLTAVVVYRQFNHTFWVECPLLSFHQSVEVQKLFLAIYTAIISQEIDDPDDTNTDDDEDDVEVQTKPNSRLIRHINPNDESQGKDSAAPSLSSSAPYPEDIRWFKSKCIWTCKSEHNVMGTIVPIQDQELIGALTGTTLVQDLNHQRIFIGTHSEERLHSAIHKLDNIRKYFFLRVLQASHIFYSEEYENFQVAMKPLVEIRKSLVETTLLDPIRRPGGNIVDNMRVLVTKTLTARCCVFNPKNGSYILSYGKKLAPVIAEENISLPMKLWVGYQYPKRGDKFLNLMRDQSPEVEVNEDKFGPRGPEMPLIDKDENIKKWQKDLPQAAATFKQMLVDSTHGPLGTVPSNSFTSHQDPQAEMLVSYLKPHVKINGQTSATPVFQQINLASSAPKNSEFEDLIDFTTDELVSSISSVSPKKPVMSTSTTPPIISTGFAPLSAEFVHKPQEQSQVDNRKYDLTMRQRVPQNTGGKHRRRFDQADLSIVPPMSNPGLTDPIDDFVAELKSKFEPLLEVMRNWAGEISLEAKFGRILVRNLHRSSVALRDHQNSFDSTWMDREILQKTGKVDFTKLVTAVPGDVDYLIFMKDAKGENFWKTDPEKWSIAYEIECRDRKDDTPFIVEIDAERFTTRVKSLAQSIGKVFVHCTLRNWDYCIATEGIKDLEKAYGSVRQGIVDTLYIPDGQEGITSMNFQIAHKEDVAVTSIRIRRNAQYMSLDRASILNITEVNDLFINGQHIEAPPRASSSYALYHGFTNDNNCIFPGPLWFEIGVLSVVATENFRQNLKLELGEEAAWTSSLMTSKNVPSTIYERACEMVKQMDGVGYWNQKCSGAEVNMDLPHTPERSLAAEAESKKRREKHRITPQDKNFW